MAGSVRAFIALDLPAEVKVALAAIQNRLRAQLAREGVDRGLRWTQPEGIHLTLKFLGETPEALVPDLGQHLDAILTGAVAPKLSLQGLGTFPNQRAPRVVWVGLGGQIAALASLQRRVESEISPLGFPTETRPFSPHLTLARVGESVGREQRERIGAVVQRLRPDNELWFEAGTVSLIRSDLLPGGAVYTPLHTVALVGSR